jgi:outer membrane protein assembly factor BamA
VELFAERSQTAAFFGIGAGREFSQQAFDDEFYNYSRLQTLLEVTRGVQLDKRRTRQVKHQRVEWFQMLSLGYNHHYDEAGTLLGQRQPFGMEGGFRQGFHTGIEADYRDHFFRPTAGSFHRVELSIHPSFTGNRRTLGKLKLESARYYEFHFLLDVVAAGRVQLSQVAGRAPFYELSMLGGEESLRGYPFDRFLDYGSAMLNLELRTWLFSLPFQNIEIGGQLFADGGTLYEYPGAPGWTDDLRGNVGFGGMMSLFNPDFMLRGDFGFSDESFRFFTGLGYVF